MKKAGVTVFLLQIQTPISIVKRWLGLGEGRQRFLIGKTSLQADTIFERLIAAGYSWDYFAYNNDGEQVSVRKLYLHRQVHVRTFSDGEIRMHDEINCEFEPIEHLQSVLVPANQTYIDEVMKVLDGTPT